ncbi:MAG: PEGA domain-containing protein [Deltaproteobacteria bacterium]|nr:PEGA domain-containing protein [Deltaproteobacteria bacterium]
MGSDRPTAGSPTRKSKRLLAASVILCASVALAFVLAGSPALDGDVASTTLVVRSESDPVPGAAGATVVSQGSRPLAPRIQGQAAMNAAGVRERLPVQKGRRQQPSPLWTPEKLAQLAEAPPPHFFESEQPAEDRPYLKGAKAPPPQRWLLVSSLPPNMMVQIDGQTVGRTPYVRPLLGDPKPFDIKVSGPGFRTESVLGREGPDGNVKVGVTMKPS